MILKALVELSEREGLMGDLDYQPKAVRWIVTINSEGQMLGEIADTLPRGRQARAAPTGRVSHPQSLEVHSTKYL